MPTSAGTTPFTILICFLNCDRPIVQGLSARSTLNGVNQRNEITGRRAYHRKLGFYCRSYPAKDKVGVPQSKITLPRRMNGHLRKKTIDPQRFAATRLWTHNLLFDLLVGVVLCIGLLKVHFSPWNGTWKVWTSTASLLCPIWQSAFERQGKPSSQCQQSVAGRGPAGMLAWLNAVPESPACFNLMALSVGALRVGLVAPCLLCS